MRGIWNLAKSSTSSGTVRLRLAAAGAACIVAAACSQTPDKPDRESRRDRQRFRRAGQPPGVGALRRARLELPPAPNRPRCYCM